jgi:hypothetical protein
MAGRRRIQPLLLLVLATVLLVAVTSDSLEEEAADNETPQQSASDAESSIKTRWNTVRGLTSTNDNAPVRKMQRTNHDRTRNFANLSHFLSFHTLVRHRRLPLASSTAESSTTIGIPTLP